MKINVDEALNASGGGFGLVARNNKDEILGVGAGQLDHIFDASIVEAVAMLKGILWAVDMGFRKIILEGDAAGIINQLNSCDSSYSLAAPIIYDIKAVKRNFQCCSFSYVPRTGNGVAHELAQYGVTLSNELYWVDEAPQWLHRFICHDCTNL